MSLRFVKSAVLSSEDGIDFGKETPIESEEAKRARFEAERSSGKSLYEQLEDQKAKKQAEYDAVTKAIFAPTKALDDEEAGFLQSLQERKQAIEERRKQEEEEALESFRKAVSNKTQEKPKMTGGISFANPNQQERKKPQSSSSSTTNTSGVAPAAPLLPVIVKG